MAPPPGVVQFIGEREKKVMIAQNALLFRAPRLFQSKI